MAMIPTIICKILMPLEYPFQMLFSIQKMFNRYNIFKKIFVDLVLNKTHITFIKDY